jgi:hypothetical protein
MAPSFERYGVRYYSSLAETFTTWSKSIKRFQDIANRRELIYLPFIPTDKTLDSSGRSSIESRASLIRL